MKDIRYVFRFRDLVARTLAEHISVIRTYNACWWGWWKRPSEDNRQEVWQELARTASVETPVPVCLFDSGTGTVYRAIVTQVIPPIDGDLDAVVHPLVPKEEEQLIPSYYRTSPFSRAWMKMTKIDEKPIKFFGHFTFASIPQLPNYSSHVLSALKNKVILDPAELRGMDTTIWEVRPRQPGDNEEKILFTIPALPSPIESRPVKTNSNTILHVTDLHFGIDAARGHHIWRLESEKEAGFTLAEAIEKAVGDRRIGAVIATGDFTFSGAEREYQEAHTALVRMLGIFNLGADHLVVVPGNHDIQWGTEEVYSDDAVVLRASDEAKKNYKAFYSTIYRHDSNVDLSMGRRFVLPSGMVLEVCAVNSSSLETGRNFLAGMGRVEEHALERAANSLGWRDQETLALRILAVHHHLALTENLEPATGYYRGFGIAVDAPRVQRMAARLGVQLALHGHKHRAFIWRSGVYELPEHAQMGYRLGDLSIIGGGSAGSTETEGESNFFNLITATPRGIELEIFRAVRGGKFDVMQRWRARLRMTADPDRLVLEDWEKS